jgi:hypothetical protein
MSKKTKPKGFKAKKSPRSKSPKAVVEVSLLGSTMRPPMMGLVLASAVARNQAGNSAKKKVVIKVFSANTLKELSDQIRSEAMAQR